ncbi:MAG TPA: TIGR00730 family Rossman fold protein [Candidatus Acidoferrum sp.]|nr:TIGR00730 family Rossman fold protein [Candidatus Acidoferrum sp.]
MSKNFSRRRQPGHLFPTAAEDILHAKADVPAGQSEAQMQSSSYRLAFDDDEFLLADDQRGVRLMLELNKPEHTLRAKKIQHTVVIFGSARTPSPELLEAAEKSGQHSQQKLAALRQQVRYYQEARKLAALITERSQCEECPQLHVITGGGPGIMEAANRGAADVGGDSIGLNIVLPHEQYPNPWITPELCFRFHYFAMRKMHFLLRARALVVFPGGFGTFDELFEALTLVQTKKIAPMPILIFGREFWSKLIDFDLLVQHGMINAEDCELFRYVDTAEAAWEIIRASLVE